MRKKNIDDAEQREHARREHLTRDLRGRRHVDEVVERAGDEHHARAEEQPDRLGVVDWNISWNWCMCDATAIAARKPTNIAAPPSVGVGFVCTWRASDDGATTAPKRIASNRTTGVSSSVVPSATAQTTA